MRWLAWLLAWLWAMLVPLTASCADAAAESEPESVRQTVAVSQDVYAGLLQAQQQVEAGDPAAALLLLDELHERSGLSDYEQAQLWNLRAYVYYLQEQYTQAIDAYEQVSAIPELPTALAHSTLKTLAQLYFNAERYPRAVATALLLHQQLQQADPELQLLLGQAYYQLGQYQQALQPIEQAIHIYRMRDVEPAENWLLLLYAIHHEQADYPRLLSVLKELIGLYPRDQHLLSLAGVYGALDDTGRQLALLDALYEKGALVAAQHTVDLAHLYLQHGVPYKAARVLQDALDAGNIAADVYRLRLLAQAWQQAQEYTRAIAPLEQAALQSDDGQLYVQLARAQLHLEQWPLAVAALHKALDKGLDPRHTADLMLGIALFNQRHLQAAREAFMAALQHAGQHHQAASQWLAHIDHELQLQAILQEQEW